MSNEELVAMIQAGAEECMGELWDQVAGLVKWRANHIMSALDLRGSPCGVELDDLIQSGYLALVKAVETYTPDDGAFSTWLIYHLKTVFAEATGYRTKKGRLAPLNNALSMDKPLTDEADSSTFGEFIPDLKAAATMEAIEEQEYQKQLHDALELALGVVPEECSEVLRLRYYQDMPTNDCGEVLGIDAEKVRQLEEKGIQTLRKPKNAACLRSFVDFNFYCYTGMTAFTHTGMSVQERYLVEQDRLRRLRKPDKT